MILFLLDIFLITDTKVFETRMVSTRWFIGKSSFASSPSSSASNTLYLAFASKNHYYSTKVFI